MKINWIAVAVVISMIAFGYLLGVLFLRDWFVVKTIVAILATFGFIWGWIIIIAAWEDTPKRSNPRPESWDKRIENE